METIDELSEISLSIDKAVAEGEIDAETAAELGQEIIITQSEGGPTSPKIADDTSYRMDKAVTFKEEYDVKQTTKTSDTGDAPNIHRVHVNTTLKINTVMWIPC